MIRRIYGSWCTWGCLCWLTFADFVGDCVVMFCWLLVLGWYLFALVGCIVA